jgi:carbon storage regulator
MLVLTRKVGEKIQIGDGITVTVLDVKGARVRIGIDAPGDVRIVRGELLEFAEAGSAKELEPETVC